MRKIYYHILIGHVISFCFLWVALYQVLSPALGPVGYEEWPFVYAACGVERRPLRSNEWAAYVQQRAKVWRYVGRVLWSGVLVWLWWVARHGGALGDTDGELALASVAGLGSGVGVRVAEPMAVAAWPALDPAWSARLAPGEAVRKVIGDKNQLSSLRRLFELEMWCVVLCVQTTEKLLVYVRADQRMNGPRCCPDCGAVAVGWKDKKGYDAVRDYDLLGKRVYLVMEKQSFRCTNWECARRSFTAVGTLRKEHGRMTERLRAGLAERLVNTDLKTNAQVLDISYRQIRAIEAELMCQAEQVAWYEAAVLKEAKELHVGLDEHSIRKGHKYVSLIYEKTLGKLWQMCRGRKKDDLVNMLKALPVELRAKIKTVTIDRSKPMLAAVKEVLKDAIIIIDKFHLVRDCGQVVQNVRKRLTRAEAKKIEAAYRKKIKGLTKKQRRRVPRRTNIYGQIRYALLRPSAYWKITAKDTKTQRQKKMEEYKNLQQALRKNKELKQAYELYQAFIELFNNKALNRQSADVALAAWYEKAEQSKLRGFKSLVKSFRRWNEYLLNYFEFKTRYTNAEVEGINNKCKIVQRQGYGVGKFEHYRHRCKRAVNGSMLGLGKVSEKRVANFLNSQEPAQTGSVGVNTGRQRKKAA